MKKIEEYTVRGQLEELGVERIQLFDGRFDTGYRIVEFQIAPKRPADALDGYGTLGTEEGTLSGGTWDWSDNTQLAWSSFSEGGGGYSPNNVISIVDPDNLIIEDLYIYANSSSTSQAINYMIKLEKYDITDWQGAVTMVRNRSQA
jgi:hypothetical protein